MLCSHIWQSNSGKVAYMGKKHFFKSLWLYMPHLDFYELIIIWWWWLVGKEILNFTKKKNITKNKRSWTLIAKFIQYIL